ncbi:YkvA family protein [Planobacterium oryzisoli]|uniref:DUF1232 domain-containing protein n=1 Tax=Planobacterium oryzisoli TaxID=2771435 RepID=A0A930YUR0_9FLAO|nr:DUF1232 domain-containing protein [Planobacterium oryzisoli]MBF5026729.1 DUF1232 domain-containing protein [Planobacterium oryzisoli]
MKYSKIHLIKEAIKHKGFMQKIPVVWRMVKMWKSGKYPLKSIDMIIPILGLLYVISPIDLIPEIAVPFIGSLDDLAILALIIPKLMKEVDKFLLWEQMQQEGLTTVEAREIK